jgi:predicted transcriptional regulator of viral defense system
MSTLVKSGFTLHPNSNQLYELAASQAGHFTTQQAEGSGYSRQLLRHHVLGGKFRRVQRGIYRFAQFPCSDLEDLMVAWLWTEGAGVFSHQTVLGLRELSDVLPARIHVTLPSAWSRSRLRAPAGLVLHYANLASTDRTWFDTVPVTTIARTLNDCAENGFEPDLLRQAAQQAMQRGLVQLAEIPAVRAALAPFGGLAA